MKVMYFNARGLEGYAKILSLKQIFDMEKPSLILIQEIMSKGAPLVYEL